MSLDERLANYVVEGTKEGLIDDLDKALAAEMLHWILLMVR